MKSPNDLFDLIKSLTPSEKGYFKKHMAKEEGKKYLKLFDAINAQKEYDEEKLKKKVGKEITNLSATKNYLYEEVLESLRAFGIKTNGFTNLNRWLEYSAILVTKKLYAQMEKVLERGREVAREYESGEYLMLYHNELLKAYRLTDNFEKIEEHIARGSEESRKYIHLIEISLQIQLVYVLLQKLVSFSAGIYTPTDKMSLLKRIYETLRSIPYPTGSAGFDQNLLNGFSVYYAHSNQRAKAFLVSRYGFYNHLNSPELYKKHAVSFLSSFNNYMLYARFLYQEEEMKEGSRRLKEFLGKHSLGDKLTVESIFQRVTFMNKWYFQLHNKSQTDAELLKQTLQWINQKQYIHQAIRINFHLIFAEHFFIRGDWRNALKFLNEIEINVIKKQGSYYKTAMLIKLLVFYDSNDQETFNRLFPSTSRELQKLTLAADETIFLNWLSEVFKNPAQFNNRTHLIQLKEELENIGEHIGELTVSSLFPIGVWIKSRLAKKPLLETYISYRNEKRITNADKIKNDKESLSFIIGSEKTIPVNS